MKLPKRTLLYACLWTLRFVNLNAQNTNIRLNTGEDSLIKSYIPMSSIPAGAPFKYQNDTMCLIFYAEVHRLDNQAFNFRDTADKLYHVARPHDENNVQPGGTVTLLYMIWSRHGQAYQRKLLDTIDYNSGCCPCHLPAIVEKFEIEYANPKQKPVLYFTIQQPVRFDCNSVTTRSRGRYTTLVDLFKE